MKPHPYLRAYMAGVLFPTIFVFVGLMLIELSRETIVGWLPAGDVSGSVQTSAGTLGFHVVSPFERWIVFPIAVVPNLWGLWNVIYLRLQGRMRYPIGLHGAVLPIVIMTTALLLGRAFDVFSLDVPFGYLAAAALVGMAIYYALWKHVVGFLNAELGIAPA